MARTINPTDFTPLYDVSISCREANGTNSHLAREMRFERDAMEVREEDHRLLREKKGSGGDWFDVGSNHASAGNEHQALKIAGH